VLLKSSKQRK